MKPLFICMGNVMRSQMAQGYYNALTGTDQAMSAGVDEATIAKFETPYKDGILVMREEGIDISGQYPKLVTPEMVEAADAVYVMTYPDIVPDFVKNSSKTVFWNIEDPFAKDLAEVRHIQQQVKEHVTQIISDK